MQHHMEERRPQDVKPCNQVENRSAVLIFKFFTFPPWRWTKHINLKYLYVSARLQGVTP